MPQDSLDVLPIKSTSLVTNTIEGRFHREVLVVRTLDPVNKCFLLIIHFHPTKFYQIHSLNFCQFIHSESTETILANRSCRQHRVLFCSLQIQNDENETSENIPSIAGTSRMNPIMRMKPARRKRCVVIFIS